MKANKLQIGRIRGKKISAQQIINNNIIQAIKEEAYAALVSVYLGVNSDEY